MIANSEDSDQSVLMHRLTRCYAGYIHVCHKVGFYVDGLKQAVRCLLIFHDVRALQWLFNKNINSDQTRLCIDSSRSVMFAFVTR